MRIRIKSIIPLFFSLLLLIGIVVANFDTTPCQASVKGSESTVFSLDVKDQPLDKVLEKVSEMTGYEITVNKEGLDFPVTASFKNVSIYEGLRRILGSLNHSIISNDKEKKISVFVVSVVSKDVQKRSNRVVSDQKEIDPLDMEVTPPLRPGERGMTLRELNALKANEKQIDPLDMEVTPPVRPGERGLTLRELKAMESQIDPLDHEVTPPLKPGERSMTLRELNALESQIDPLDHEVTPPLKPGERGMTLRELNTLEGQRQKINPLEYEMTPP